MITASFMLAASAFALCFVLGVALGTWLSGLRWSSNALDYKRIEFLGELYHVVRAGDVKKARQVAEDVELERQEALRASWLEP